DSGSRGTTTDAPADGTLDSSELIRAEPTMSQLTLRNRVLTAAGILGFVGAIVAFDLGCPGGTDSSSDTSGKVARVEINSASESEEIGNTFCFQATVFDSHGVELSGKTITWSSSQPQVASVGSSGCVQALTVGGPVTITATSEGKSATTSFTSLRITVAS